MARKRARSTEAVISQPPRERATRMSKRIKVAMTETEGVAQEKALAVVATATEVQVVASTSTSTISTSNVNMKAKGKGKAKKSQEVDLASLPVRTKSLWKVGAHVSAAGGVENSLLNAAKIGANSFALFVKSQRKWSSPPLTESSIAAFKERMMQLSYVPKHILPHGSYLINLGNPDRDKREKSYECFLDDLKRCDQLGLLLYNFHPGSTLGTVPPSTSISYIAESINRAHNDTPGSNMVAVIENMAGAGNIIGGDFKHLGEIIEQVEDKTRVGVCLDTLEKFDADVGLKYLRGMHLNDSKTECGSNKDRHENIGIGHLKLQTFHHILTDPRVQDIPLVLETPSHEENTRNWDVWAKEIEVLNRLSPEHVAEGERNGVELEAEHFEGPASPERNPEHMSLSPTSPRSESDLKVWTEEIRKLVGGASALSSGRSKAKKMQGKGTKKKRKGESEDDRTEDEGDS
ncbi:DNA-(apurinic or apyrimidinic site) lyase [Marasmius tenuissimus]|uniref:DNA-(Apurinic or apyrimidinic site) lyase n=1 Tax=Marasmius tenuissimus TaxID=585030 RepID=A0ABR2ZT19_9AGAR